MFTCRLKVWDDKHPNVDVYNDNEYSGVHLVAVVISVRKIFLHQCWIV